MTSTAPGRTTPRVAEPFDLCSRPSPSTSSPADSPRATGWTMAFDQLAAYIEAQ
ncbi:MAG: hypothetical protein ACR2JF_01855 [Iamia sp.]